MIFLNISSVVDNPDILQRIKKKTICTIDDVLGPLHCKTPAAVIANNENG